MNILILTLLTLTNSIDSDFHSDSDYTDSNSTDPESTDSDSTSVFNFNFQEKKNLKLHFTPQRPPFSTPQRNVPFRQRSQNLSRPFVSAGTVGLSAGNGPRRGISGNHIRREVQLERRNHHARVWSKVASTTVTARNKKWRNFSVAKWVGRSRPSSCIWIRLEFIFL